MVKNPQQPWVDDYIRMIQEERKRLEQENKGGNQNGKQ